MRSHVLSDAVAVEVFIHMDFISATYLIVWAKSVRLVDSMIRVLRRKEGGGL